MAKPLVSVVIIAYNHEPFIGDAIESVLAQTYDNIEIIVVDDHSADDTRNFVLESYFKKVKYIRNEINLGPSNTSNVGLAAASGEYVALLAGDDRFVPHKIETQLKLLLSHPKPMIVFSNHQFIDESGDKVETKDNPFRETAFNLSQESILGRFFKTGNFLVASSALFPKSLLERIGFFDPCLLQLQDFDFWLRAALSGIEIKVFAEKLLEQDFPS